MAEAVVDTPADAEKPAPTNSAEASIEAVPAAPPEVKAPEVKPPAADEAPAEAAPLAPVIVIKKV